ncbi:MAG: ABC transporter ATP-binding protein [Bacteroidetes bacterium]|nr:ABC transporter ATP-binding protein [Bacteroidota bacterium]
MPALLSIKNLSVDFISEDETVSALKNISFDVHRGEILALVGESGSGKSVTSLSVLKLLPASAQYSNGEILFSENGTETEDLLKKNSKELQPVRGNKIAMIFQEPMTSLNPVITCGKQVTEAIQQHQKLSFHAAKTKTIEWFQKVKLPDPDSVFTRYPHQLSGGQKQRVMIAMAMCCHPSLLICDEPTTALDVTVQKTILELIKELQTESNMGVIFITHDLGLVAEIADRALVMYRGEMVEHGFVRDLFINAKHPYTKALLACRPANHKKNERLPVVSDFINSKEETKSQETEPLVLIKEQQKDDQQSVLLQVENLSVWFPTKKSFLGKPIEFTKAVNDVSFSVYKGETLGLVGESGCGKTTLGRTLLRLIEPTSGKIIYNGTDLAKKRKEELASLRKDIQIVFQDPYSSLNPRLTIGSAIAEPLKVHHLISKQKVRKEKVVELLEKVGLKAEHFSRYPHEFSGGQRQRIVIARALALSPSFLVCDESVSALDVSVQAQVLNLLNDLKKEYGFTIVFISHDLSVVYYISDRIMVMNKGKIEETGSAETVYHKPQTEYTQKLIAAIPGGKVA